MRLLKLRMQNFRQHVDSTIDFDLGITGIIGANGAGKSTILEAIAWSVYGSSAARGTNDTIRFSRAAPRSRVVVDFSFELENHEYRISRTLNSAEVYLDNGMKPVATGVGGATGYLQSKLGMTRDEFFNTYFTGQKELQFLAQMGPSERGRFLAQVLGYERLRRAQDLARHRRKEIAAELEGLKTGLADPALLKAEREAAEQRLKEAKKNAAKASKVLQKLDADHEAALPAWQAAQQARERAQKLVVEIESAERELESAQREVDRTRHELHKVAAAQESLDAIKPQLEELLLVSAATEKLDELSIANARYTALKQNEATLLSDMERLDRDLVRLKQAPDLLKKAQQDLLEINKVLPEKNAQREKLLKQWQEDAQDNRTQLRMLQDAERELLAQIKRLESAGDAGNCPVCQKPLGHEYDAVYAHLNDELEARRQDIKLRQRLEKKYKDRPPELVEAETALAQLQASWERKIDREAKCEKAAEELWKATEEKQLKEQQLSALRKELKAIPTGYDRDQHLRLRKRLEELREFARQATVFEHEIKARGTREKDAESARQRHEAGVRRIEQLRVDLNALGFDAKIFEKGRLAFEKLRDELNAAKVREGEANQALRGAEAAVATAMKAEAAYTEKREKLLGLASDLRHHNEMDAVLTRLRTELNARVRPELAELASAFLSDITDGRYNALEIDENYNVLVLEDGEEKPVISGGEEDVANLVLRIAISQMIAERAGQKLSALFLDEVFGSLDVERRENVIQLLQKLNDRFEQVILITHIETVREGLDHVIRLEYDARTGASVVKADSPATAPAGAVY